MKKIFATVLMFCTLTLALPQKKAEAGFMIVAATQEFVWHHKYETLDTVLVIALPVSLITTGIFAVGIAGNPFNGATLVAGAILLDEKIEHSRNDIKGSLVARYPFIDDEAAISNLADKIIGKYESSKEENGNAIISLSKEEVSEATAMLDLTSAELADLASLN